MQMDEKMSDYTVMEHLVELPRTQEGLEWLAKRKHYLNLRHGITKSLFGGGV